MYLKACNGDIKMDKLGVYSDFHKNVEPSAFFMCNTKAYSMLVNPSAKEKKEAGADKNAQENLSNVHGRHMKDLAWGRVLQKGNTDASGNKPLMCAFAELPTALELFKKARNMDRRNVEERTFVTGGKVVDFTV